MEITVNLSEEELLEEAKKIAANRIADDIFSDYRSGKYCYRNAIKEIVREVIKSDIDNLSERAVAAAAKSVENRAVKKYMEQMLKEM